jgi:hypothetical protein
MVADESAATPMKTGGRLVKHARYYWLLLAEPHLNRRLFGGMLEGAAGIVGGREIDPDQQRREGCLTKDYGKEVVSSCGDLGWGRRALSRARSQEK